MILNGINTINLNLDIGNHKVSNRKELKQDFELSASDFSQGAQPLELKPFDFKDFQKAFDELLTNIYGENKKDLKDAIKIFLKALIPMFQSIFMNKPGKKLDDQKSGTIGYQYQASDARQSALLTLDENEEFEGIQIRLARENPENPRLNEDSLKQVTLRKESEDSLSLEVKVEN